MGVEQQGTSDIVDNENHSFDFAFLLWLVQEAKGDAMCSEQRMRSVIIEFVAIVNLHRLEWEVKLGANISVIRESIQA